MEFKWVGWCGTVYLGLTLICNILSGAFITAADISHMQKLGITQTTHVGMFTVPIPNTNFISGLMKMLDFKEYNALLFTGMAGLIYYFLAIFSFVVAFMLFIAVLSLMVNAIRIR